MPHPAIGRETQAGLQLQGSKGSEVLVRFWDTSRFFLQGNNYALRGRKRLPEEKCNSRDQ
jgi:hypothetical protein